MATAVYKSLNEIIDSLMLDSKTFDNYLSDVEPHTILQYARLGLREVIMKDTAAMHSLRVDVIDYRATLPNDFVRLERLSALNAAGTLTLIAANKNISTANALLLDDMDVILLDDSGVQLTGDGDTDIDRSKITSYKWDDPISKAFLNRGSWGSGYFNPTYDYFNINPTFARGVGFKVDVDKGIIQFQGEELETVVIDYIYDPTKNVGSNDQLQIHSLFALPLQHWIYNEIISRKRSVPLGEKERAAKALRKSLLEAKLAKNTPSVSDILRVTNAK